MVERGYVEREVVIETSPLNRAGLTLVLWKNKQHALPWAVAVYQQAVLQWCCGSILIFLIVCFYSTTI